MAIDWTKVSDRIRGLIGAGDDRGMAGVAAQLRVDEKTLRPIVNREPRKPDLVAVAAIIRMYGLDPTWVLTGMYDRSTHRTALESNTDEIAITLNRMTSERSFGDDSHRAPGAPR